MKERGVQGTCLSISQAADCSLLLLVHRRAEEGKQSHLSFLLYSIKNCLSKKFNSRSYEKFAGGIFKMFCMNACNILYIYMYTYSAYILLHILTVWKCVILYCDNS